MSASSRYDTSSDTEMDELADRREDDDSYSEEIEEEEITTTTTKKTTKRSSLAQWQQKRKVCIKRNIGSVKQNYE